MNILITGITGYFGSQLAREFSQLGQIHGLKRKTSQTDLLKDAALSVQWHEGDVTDMDSLLDALKSIDLVIHAAGMVSFSAKDEDHLYKINSEGTANVVNAMLTAGADYGRSTVGAGFGLAWFVDCQGFHFVCPLRCWPRRAARIPCLARLIA